MIMGNHFSLLTVPLFFLFSSFVVYICQRLVEQAAIAIEPMERRSAFIRTSCSIGFLTWSLDAAGQFMYPEIITRECQLPQAMVALLVMILGGLIAIPEITNTRHRRVIILASLILALTMLVGHVLLFLSFGSFAGEIRWSWMLTSIAITIGIATVLSLRHRSERLRAFHGGFRPLSWWENLLAGATIIPLHCFLAASIPLVPENQGKGHGEALLVFVLLGVLVALLNLYTSKMETDRRKLLERAHARLRVLPDVPGMSEGQQLSLIAERLSVLLTPENLQFHFQPIMPIKAGGSGIRFEALLRINDRQLGQINPEMFILACARVGRQIEADRMIILRALEISRDWLVQVPCCAGISVNVAPDTIYDFGFVTWLEAEMMRYAIPLNWLKLEITEHSMISTTPGFAEQLYDLRTLGVGVMLDDFGTGFSSLGVISNLPLEGLKIDRSLTQRLEENRSSQKLLKHLSAMGKDLGLQVTVEGAETMEQLAIICRCRVDSVQGYIFAKPLAPEMVPAWIQQHSFDLNEDNVSMLPVIPDWLLNLGNKQPTMS
jgi:EAL domain-containing protein (putative c-di-GMP-specific phosphodiesterase class I)